MDWGERGWRTEERKQGGSGERNSWWVNLEAMSLWQLSQDKICSANNLPPSPHLPNGQLNYTHATILGNPHIAKHFVFGRVQKRVLYINDTVGQA